MIDALEVFAVILKVVAVIGLATGVVLVVWANIRE